MKKIKVQKFDSKKYLNMDFENFLKYFNSFKLVKLAYNHKKSNVTTFLFDFSKLLIAMLMSFVSWLS